MDWIEIKLDGAWDIIWLTLLVIAIITSSSFLISFVRSFLTKKTEINKLDTIKVVKQQVDLLEEQIHSLTNQVQLLYNTNEETRLHKIELMKANVIIQDNINKLVKDNHDLSKQIDLLEEQNVLLTEQIKELKLSKEFLKKEITLLKSENNALKIKK